MSLKETSHKFTVVALMLMTVVSGALVFRDASAVVARRMRGQQAQRDLMSDEVHRFDTAQEGGSAGGPGESSEGGEAAESAE
mmetsp:Transcript_5524/g.17681  ORF Transcript_5524/g.17681 Transcript_5524/m.17681 type:complete len:82 (-) Transcript_5524:200-445(-)